MPVERGDGWLIRDIAWRLHYALTSPCPFRAGYVLHSAKFFASQFDDSAIGARAHVLCTAVYIIRAEVPSAD